MSAPLVTCIIQKKTNNPSIGTDTGTNSNPGVFFFLVGSSINKSGLLLAIFRDLIIIKLENVLFIFRNKIS